MHSEDDDLTVIVLCNLSISSVPTELADGLAALAMGEDPEPLRLAASPLDPDAARHLAGEYRFGEDFYVPNTSMRIVAADGQLRVDGAPPGALLRLATGGADGDAVFIHRQQWVRVRFDSDDSGRATAMQYGPFRATRDGVEP